MMLGEKAEGELVLDVEVEAVGDMLWLGCAEELRDEGWGGAWVEVWKGKEEELAVLVTEER
jgi:hypothetical protein